jgi:hypothetical protein
VRERPDLRATTAGLALLHVEGRLGEIPSGHIQGTWRRNTVGNDEKGRALIPEVTVCCTTKRLFTSPRGAVRELQVSHDLHGLVVEAAAEKMPSSHPAFCAPDLISQVHGILPADHNRRAGAGPTRVHEAAHATPDVPLRELSRVGPPVPNVLPAAF